jgi:RES domain-containing protein
MVLHDTHRLIPSRHSEAGTVLSRLTEREAELNDLAELDGATNPRLLGEEGLLPGIGVHELVYGVRYGHIVNAAFTHPAPSGGRFNGSQRGAWYAGLELATSAAEVAFHKRLQLEEVDWPSEEVATYDDYLADFAAEFHNLTASRPQHQKYFRPAPVPECYREPQRLAETLLSRQSNGILYPSVRRKSGTCLVCFRPALVYRVRRKARYEMRVRAGETFQPKTMKELKIT